ncbi:MAG: hypothetical protein COU25_01470 [Candidatus Levybacteria bacterium CG10_big_fil_rev_8_21_14_0_10_35_13]|nr:MAG: hypothetical protein COU25_01470 [Candidatus Levybacteria bacterium CG10_big_fil_rev_8_21_14_0_10_35_13]
MKKAGIALLPILLLLLSANTASAENTVNESQSTSNIRVSTQTDGGNVSTHIETTVNGKTQIIESNEEGEIIVENKNGEVTVKKSTPNTTITNVTKTPASSSTQSASIDKEVGQKEEFKKSFIEIFISSLKDFFKRIFSNL